METPIWYMLVLQEHHVKKRLDHQQYVTHLEAAEHLRLDYFFPSDVVKKSCKSQMPQKRGVLPC